MYSRKLKYHYYPKKGWVNDPNGLVYFNGYYHVFYQHAPDYEKPWQQSMHWGHARTKDFISFEELPVALYPNADYDYKGCWSGTAIVKDDTLFLVYASISLEGDGETRKEMVSIAYSKDGINFTKYENNPIIKKMKKLS
jgi:beta-fructofuranosidase